MIRSCLHGHAFLRFEPPARRRTNDTCAFHLANDAITLITRSFRTLRASWPRWIRQGGEFLAWTSRQGAFRVDLVVALHGVKSRNSDYFQLGEGNVYVVAFKRK